MLTPENLLRLARVYGAATGLSLSAVGRKAGKNNRIFLRLAEGRGANSRSIERLEAFFYEHWPDGVTWPADIPYLPPPPSRPNPTVPTNCFEPAS